MLSLLRFTIGKKFCTHYEDNKRDRKLSFIKFVVVGKEEKQKEREDL